jgi:hypothetical protein
VISTVSSYFFIKKRYKKICSVADPGCLSRILDPDFYPSRIPDPKTGTTEGGEKNLLSYLFCNHKFHKIVNYFMFEMLKKQIWANIQRIIELPKKLPKTQKIVTKLSKYGFGIRDPRSGKNLFRIPDSGVKKAPDPGSGSATLYFVFLNFWSWNRIRMRKITVLKTE